MKTPLTELKEWIEIKQSIGQFTVKDLFWKIDQLLPKEKEVIEKAVFDTMAQGHMNLFMTNKIDKTEKEFFTNVAKTYFNETFTQK